MTRGHKTIEAALVPARANANVTVSKIEAKVLKVTINAIDYQAATGFNNQIETIKRTEEIVQDPILETVTTITTALETAHCEEQTAPTRTKTVTKT